MSQTPLFSNVNYSSDVDRYKHTIRTVINDNPQRLCVNLIALSIFGSLNTCDIILLSYATIGKNYVNGIATLRIDVASQFVSIDYLCADLHFSGIGFNLITFIKLFTINILNENFHIILDSVLNPQTQNFYRSQYFYDVAGLRIHPIFGEVPVFETRVQPRFNYIWKYDDANLEESYTFAKCRLPFAIKKVLRVRPSPELINELKSFKLYSRSASIFERGRALEIDGVIAFGKRRTKRSPNKRKPTVKRRSK